MKFFIIIFLFLIFTLYIVFPSATGIAVQLVSGAILVMMLVGIIYGLYKYWKPMTLINRLKDMLSIISVIVFFFLCISLIIFFGRACL